MSDERHRERRARSAGDAGTKTSTTRVRRPSEGRGRSLAGLVVLIVAMAGLFLAVMPIRTYLGQRHSASNVSQQLAKLDKENASLSAQIRQLSTPVVIEQIARARYGLVRPGERSFVVLPAPSSQTQVGSVPSGSAVPAGSQPVAPVASPASTKPTSSAPASTAPPRPPKH